MTVALSSTAGDGSTGWVGGTTLYLGGDNPANTGLWLPTGATTITQVSPAAAAVAAVAGRLRFFFCSLGSLCGCAC